MSAPMGIRHGKATVPFSVVEQCRYLRKRKGYTVRMLSKKFGVPADTVNDWVFYRSRILC